MEGFVAVTVYVLAVEADVLAVFEPLLQTKVAPAVVDVACKVSEVLTQFKTVSIPALTVGKVLFKVTITASDAVHPLIVFVTVTVKVPADETEVFGSSYFAFICVADNRVIGLFHHQTCLSNIILTFLFVHAKLP